MDIDLQWGIIFIAPLFGFLAGTRQPKAMEGFFTEGVKQLALQGTGWMIACFMSGCVAWLARKLYSVQEECQEAREALHEKRLVEARETLAALHAVAEAQGELAQSIMVRTETLKVISELVTRVEREMSTSYAHWQQRADGWEKSYEEIIRCLKVLLEARRRD